MPALDHLIWVCSVRKREGPCGHRRVWRQQASTQLHLPGHLSLNLDASLVVSFLGAHGLHLCPCSGSM